MIMVLPAGLTLRRELHADFALDIVVPYMRECHFGLLAPHAAAHVTAWCSVRACRALASPNTHTMVWCRYGLNTQYLTHADFKAGLEEYLTEAGTAAIVLGTRR